MNWQQRLENITLTITTGDGKIYTPLWDNAQKNQNFNTEGFDFIGVPGTFVERKESSGRQFPVSFYFQGEDCIDKANEFEISSRDKRAWKIKHPFYDEITCQPLSLSYDNTSYNISKITGTLWETTSEKFPIERRNIRVSITIQKSSFDVVTVATFTDNIGTPLPDSIQPSIESSVQTGKLYGVMIDNDSDAAELKNLTNQASASAQEMIGEPTRYMQQTVDLINFPFLIVQSIETKIAAMVEVAGKLADIFIKDDNGNYIEEETEENSQNQINYESQVSTVLTELSKNIVNAPASDYDTRQKVVDTIETLSAAYESVLNDFDEIGYNQDKQLSQQLDIIVNTALANLYEVAFQAKQERFYLLDKDDNIVTLAHRFYGPGDDNLQSFVDLNSIKKNEYLGMKKGRQIVYYI